MAKSMPWNFLKQRLQWIHLVEDVAPSECIKGDKSFVFGIGMDEVEATLSGAIVKGLTVKEIFSEFPLRGNPPSIELP